ncbi:MAG: ATP-binding cassette domain-containing protein [Acidimicrobiales bacterium]
MAEIAIETEQLRRTFGDFEAVAGVDLQVHEGEIYGFLGPNGAGKSTIVKVLCTLLVPSGGRASVAGFDVARQPHDVRLHMGAALQDAAVDPKLTGRETLELQGRYYGLRKDEVARQMARVLRLVDIGDAIDRRVGTYSGGMRRRLDLAASLVHNPQVLFLDEPTTGLDPVSRVRVWDEVRHLNEDLGMTIFLTTQYLEEADQLADRLGIINEGRIVAEGTPADLKARLSSDVVEAVVAGDPRRAAAAVEPLAGVKQVAIDGARLTISVDDAATTIAPVAVALNGSEVSVQELTLRRPTLDDVFLQLTGEHLPGDDEPQEVGP